MQSYQFKRPETLSIRREVARELFRQWQFWSLLSFAVIFGVLLVVYSVEALFIQAWILIPVVMSIYIGRVQGKIRNRFWKKFADINGWQYEHYGNSEQELSMMLSNDYGRDKLISHILKGAVDGRQFRIFKYSFAAGRSRDSTKHDYTVFAFKFKGSFPNIYLNYKYNSFGVSAGETVPLPSEFSEKFTLSAPRKYEIEALEIFTTDILAKLLDKYLVHDVELVDSEVLIFAQGVIENFDQLEKEFRIALEIEDLLDEKLDKFKFDKIGDMPHYL